MPSELTPSQRSHGDCADRRPWWRLPLCWTGWCGAVQNSDDKYIWAECVTCGKVIAPISREAVRRYIQAQESDFKFFERMRSEGRIPADAVNPYRAHSEKQP